MKSELTDAEQAWMDELDRLGIEHGLDGFPLHPKNLHLVSFWVIDFEAGLTPRQALHHKFPNAVQDDYQSNPDEVQDPGLTDVFKCRSCGALNAPDSLVPKEWPESCPHCGSDEADLIAVSVNDAHRD